VGLVGLGEVVAQEDSPAPLDGHAASVRSMCSAKAGGHPRSAARLRHLAPHQGIARRSVVDSLVVGQLAHEADEGPIVDPEVPARRGAVGAGKGGRVDPEGMTSTRSRAAPRPRTKSAS